MAKPRVFISSTYYDLKYIRSGLEQFIDELGYEPVLFESGHIPFEHAESLDVSCYKEIESCHILVLIIGGRYGSKNSISGQNKNPDTKEFFTFYNSITQSEYEKAKKENIPIYIFVEKSVYAEYETYKENKENITIKYAHVDNIGVFKLLDAIGLEKRNNLTRTFESLSDITLWLKEQWAGLFASYLSKSSEIIKAKQIQDKLESLNEITITLQSYTESLMLGKSKEENETLIHDLKEKLKQSEISRYLERQPIKWLMPYMLDKPTHEMIYNEIIKSESLSEFISKFNFEKDNDLILKFSDDNVRFKPSRDYQALRDEIITKT